MRTGSIKETLALAYAAEAVEASAHHADPGVTGDNEITAIPRAALAWDSGVAEDGRVDAARLIFELPPNSVVTHVGLWSADGRFLDSVESDILFSSGGFYRVSLSYIQE